MKKQTSRKISVRKVPGAGPLPEKVRPQAVRRAKSSSPASHQKQSERANFPIAAIGFSAGGLQALKDVFSYLPVETGMAFVIIQHLDPKHGSMSREILSRSTKMPVIVIEEGMRVRPNHVYVIPPNCNLGLSDGGRLQILPRAETRGQHMPLDFFFRRLAEERKSQAIGVVLSGTASDGTQGLIAIKNEGGITLVQDPRTSKFDGMPRSAIASGAVDLICPPKGIAAELARIARHSYVASRTGKKIRLLLMRSLKAWLRFFLSFELIQVLTLPITKIARFKDAWLEECCFKRLRTSRNMRTILKKILAR
ncbi:MAG: chemotaxis protein CheB [Bdellovibrionales bacterium]|nr:chemotaxis protein CheB [Bdellovibrionales bacterium]